MLLYFLTIFKAYADSQFINGIYGFFSDLATKTKLGHISYHVIKDPRQRR